MPTEERSILVDFEVAAARTATLCFIWAISLYGFNLGIGILIVDLYITSLLPTSGWVVTAVGLIISLLLGWIVVNRLKSFIWFSFREVTQAFAGVPELYLIIRHPASPLRYLSLLGYSFFAILAYDGLFQQYKILSSFNNSIQITVYLGGPLLTIGLLIIDFASLLFLTSSIFITFVIMTEVLRKIIKMFGLLVLVEQVYAPKTRDICLPKVTNSNYIYSSIDSIKNFDRESLILDTDFFHWLMNLCLLILLFLNCYHLLLIEFGNGYRSGVLSRSLALFSTAIILALLLHTIDLSVIKLFTFRSEVSDVQRGKGLYALAVGSEAAWRDIVLSTYYVILGCASYWHATKMLPDRRSDVAPFLSGYTNDSPLLIYEVPIQIQMIEFQRSISALIIVCTLLSVAYNGQLWYRNSGTIRSLFVIINMILKTPNRALGFFLKKINIADKDRRVSTLTPYIQASLLGQGFVIGFALRAYSLEGSISNTIYVYIFLISIIQSTLIFKENKKASDTLQFLDYFQVVTPILAPFIGVLCYLIKKY